MRIYCELLRPSVSPVGFLLSVDLLHQSSEHGDILFLTLLTDAIPLVDQVQLKLSHTLFKEFSITEVDL